MSDEENFLKNIHTIKLERKSCIDLNKSLLSECKDNKKLLDTNYKDLYFYIACIQTSVIFFSTVSAFIQALGSTINISSNVQFIISLIISTYISLILSLSKFFKLDERKENVHNLREKFAVLHNKIRYILDTLKPWNQNGYVHINNIDERLESWKKIKDNIFLDYDKIIEDKETLFMEFEKLIDTNQKNKYSLKIKQQEDIHRSHLEKYIEKNSIGVNTETLDVINNDNTNDNHV